MGWMVNVTPWSIYPRERAPEPIVEAAWAQRWYGRLYISENRLTHRSSNSGPSSLWRVTGCTISAHKQEGRYLNMAVTAYLSNILSKLFQTIYKFTASPTQV
jgi:hypothetical protein